MIENKGAYTSTVEATIIRAGKRIPLGRLSIKSWHPNIIINLVWQLRDYVLNRYYKYNVSKQRSRYNNEPS